VLKESIFDNYSEFTIWNDATCRAVEGEQIGPSYFKNSVDQTGHRGIIRKEAGQEGTIFNLGFVNNGDLFLQGYTIRFMKQYEQLDPGSLLDLEGGDLIADPGVLVHIAAGIMRGGGTIDGSLLMDGGTLEIGTNPAYRVLQINGDYTQVGSATLQIA